MKIIGSTVVLLLLLSAMPASAADLNCRGGANAEEFRYNWRLRGGLSWVAGLMFPTSGVGTLKTTFPGPNEHTINSELLITASEGRKGFYMYESQMDEAAERTFMTYQGYAYGSKARKERTVLDYAKNLAHLHKETPQKAWDQVQPLPSSQIRDILTAIYFLRRNAGTITSPLLSTVYSNGKEYPVVFRRLDRQVFTLDNTRVNAVAFEIVDAPGGKKFPGGAKVYLSEDARRIPFRIEIRQSVGSVQLDLQSIESCSFMNSKG
jgi:hypothetical protein